MIALITLTSPILSVQRWGLLSLCISWEKGEKKGQIRNPPVTLGQTLEKEKQAALLSFLSCIENRRGEEREREREREMRRRGVLLISVVGQQRGRNYPWRDMGQIPTNLKSTLWFNLVLCYHGLSKLKDHHFVWRNLFCHKLCINLNMSFFWKLLPKNITWMGWTAANEPKATFKETVSKLIYWTLTNWASPCKRAHSVVVITSALHAEGPRFEPGWAQTSDCFWFYNQEGAA